MRKKQIVITLCFLLAFLPGLVSSSPESTGLKAEVEKILEQYPAFNAAERDTLANKILKLGPKGINILFSRLVPPGTADDSKARFAVNSLAVYSGQKGREKNRILFSRSLIKAIESPGDPSVKAFLIRQLQLVGKKESIKILSRLLHHAVLYEPAAQALVTIHSKDAEKALLKSLRSASGQNRITIIKSLGELRSMSAVKKIRKHATSNDINLRQVVLFALANIGDPASEKILRFVDLATSSYERSKAPSLYLLYANRLAESGHRTLSTRIARSLIHYYTTHAEGHIACFALDLLVDNLGDRSLPDLLDAMNSPNDDLRGQALNLASMIPGKKATKAWIQKAISGPPAIRAEIIAMLGERKDPGSEDFLTGALNSKEKAVRMAAIPAAILLLGSRSLPTLISHLNSTDIDEITALKQALLMMPGNLVVPDVVKVIDNVPPLAQAALIDILTDKLAVEHKDKVFSFTKNENIDVRLAALKGITYLSDPEDLPRLLELFQESTISAETTLILNAVTACANQIEDSDNRSEAIISEIQICSGKKQADLLKLLPRTGGENALKIIKTHLDSDDIKVQTASVVALSSWPALDAADDLLTICRNSGNRKFVYLAVQGYVQLAVKANIKPEEKLKMLREVLDIPMQNEEKKLIFKGLAAVPIKESAEMVSPYMEDPILKAAAASAAVRIITARKRNEQEKPGIDAILALKKASWAIEDPEEKKRINVSIRQFLQDSGFSLLFNEKDLTGWKGLVGDPVSRAKMTPDKLESAQKEADNYMRSHWKAFDGIFVFDGKGHSICTAKDYRDFEMFVDWKIEHEGDSGIYLRGSPQVQIWDPAQWPEGSGGLYNNKQGPGKPLKKADHPVGDWNTFYIKITGERVTVYLNNVLVVDNVVMENYWERNKPIYSLGQIELQAHSTPLHFRNIYIREIRANR